MKCSACGAKTWLSHGAGSAVLCKNCADKGESGPSVYFQESSEKPDVALVIPEMTPVNPEERAIELEEPVIQPEDAPDIVEESAVQPENISVKPAEPAVTGEEEPVEPPVKSEEASVLPEKSANHSSQVQSDYKTSVLIARFVSFIGWTICCIAILMIFVTLIDGVRSGLLSLDTNLELLSDRVLLGMKSGLILLGPGLVLFSAGLLMIVVGQAGRALFDHANNSRQMLELMRKKNSL